MKRSHLKLCQPGDAPRLPMPTEGVVAIAATRESRMQRPRPAAKGPKDHAR